MSNPNIKSIWNDELLQAGDVVRVMGYRKGIMRIHVPVCNVTQYRNNNGSIALSFSMVALYDLPNPCPKEEAIRRMLDIYSIDECEIEVVASGGKHA